MRRWGPARVQVRVGAWAVRLVHPLATLASVATLASSALGCSTGKIACPSGTGSDRCIDGVPPADAGGSPVDGGVAPTFGGVTSAAPASATALQITWNPAFDAETARADLRYRIYVAKSPAAIAFDRPVATSSPGAVFHVLEGLEPSTRYKIAVRAVTGLGREDENRIEKSAATALDTAAPSFAGAGRALIAGGGSVRVAWKAAKDDLTAGPGISYLVFSSPTLGGHDFGRPTLATPPGQLSAELSGAASTNAFIVVRARDAAGNVDPNTSEITPQSGTSFSFDVQPIFTASCAVLGCHVPGNPQQGMILVEGFAYDEIVTVPSSEDPRFFRVTPGAPEDSYLFQKVEGTALRGTRMPAPGTGNVLTDIEKDVIRQWIAEGALNN